MKFWTKLLVPVLVLSLVGVAEAKAAKGEKKAKHEGVAGKLVSVSDGTLTISHGGKKAGAKEVTVKTDASTKVTIDGVSGKAVSDLKPGEKVVVSPATGTATEIKATSPKAKAGKTAKKNKKTA
jgi:hypothetical protein